MKNYINLFVFNLLLFGTIITTSVLGQGSPEASKNSRSQDFPVNQYTGAVSVNLPIYTFTEGSISIPISISYNTTGIRVREKASWCGLGWTLNAGASVSRIVRGLPDEGSFEGENFRFGYYQRAYSINNDIDDHEPDLFIANINGEAFKFMFDNNQNIQTIPKSDIKITPFITSSNIDSRVNRISGFKITTTDGNTYVIGSIDGNGSSETKNVYEYSLSKIVYGNGDEAYQTSKNLSDSDRKLVVSNAWYLVQVVSPYGQSVKIDYKYNYFSYEMMGVLEPDKNFNYSSGTYPFTMSYFAVPVIASIIGQNTKVDFFKQNYFPCTRMDPETGESVNIMCEGGDSELYTERKDFRDWEVRYSNSNKGRILKDIIVSSNVGGVWQPKVSYKFNYDYFTTSNPWGGSSTFSDTTPLYRLRLSNIVFPDGLVTNFTYYEPTDGRSFPPSSSFVEDHWGYYRGGNPIAGSLIGNIAACQTTLPTGSNNSSVKTTDASLSKTFSLQKISTSTGLETSFEYEVHDASNYSDLIGGNRVSKIINKDLISNIVTVKTYKYKQFANSAISSGFLIMEPVYRFSYPSGNAADYGYNSGLYELALSALGRPVISYKNVEETVYSFRGDVSAAVNDANKIGYSRYTFNQDELSVNVCSGSEGYSYKPWAFKPSIDYLSGSQSKVENFANNGNLISVTQYEYFTNYESSIPGFYIVRFNGQRKKDAANYNLNISHFGLRKRTDILYDYSGANFVKNITEYYYKNDIEIPSSYRNTYPGVHHQVVKIVSKDSRDRVTEQWNKYAGDFDFGTHLSNNNNCRYTYDYNAQDWVEICDTYEETTIPTNAEVRAIYDLKQKNMLASPVETFVKKNNKITSAKYTTYYQGTGLPKDVYQLRIFPLVSISEAYWPGSSSNLGAGMNIDGNYVLSNTILSYNQYGFPKMSKVNFGPKSELSYQMNELLPYQSTEGKDTSESQTTTKLFDDSIFSITKQIQPNGFSHSFIYDGANRPLRVTNQNNQILKQIEYKMKGQ